MAAGLAAISTDEFAGRRAFAGRLAVVPAGDLTLTGTLAGGFAVVTADEVAVAGARAREPAIALTVDVTVAAGCAAALVPRARQYIAVVRAAAAGRPEEKDAKANDPHTSEVAPVAHLVSIIFDAGGASTGPDHRPLRNRWHEAQFLAPG